MNNETRNDNFLKNTLKGLPLGISAAVPGVSAGTIAIIEKCYDTIINNIAEMRKNFKKSFLTLLPFLLGYLLGYLLAILGIKWGYEAAPMSITGLFGGFIIGSLPSIFVELKKGETTKDKFLLMLPLLISFIVASSLGILSALLKIDFTTSISNHDWWIYPYVFFAGAIGAGACLVPGVSGSMCLLVMGLYKPLVDTFIGEKAFYVTGDILNGIILGVLLLLGALVGLVIASKGMKVLLEKHHNGTYYAIFGLILGSIISIFINSEIYPLYVPEHPAWDFVIGAILLVGGAILTYIMYKKITKKE